MHIHILGICGTFMGSLALIARQCGHRVTGCDAGVYPPMSTQLAEQGIELTEGYAAEQTRIGADLYVIGNAISRGNPLVEAILEKGLRYDSGPGFLGRTLLHSKWVLAVSGTHGKTTTASMLAWILDQAGMAPGFLIGGIPRNFGLSARVGETDFFVIEADEYDTAFFDKRSKFVHYRPRTLIINNLEFDHADIFPDLAAIQTQFHHLVRTVPQTGQVIYPADVPAIEEVMMQGCWSEIACFAKVTDEHSEQASATWSLLESDGSRFQVMLGGQHATVEWSLTGRHNVENALAAMLAARHVGVQLSVSAEALCRFESVKRRMELLAVRQLNNHEVNVYDDFAHHPTAIKTTLEGLRNQVAGAQIIAVIEPRSNTMKRGVHKRQLLESTASADIVIWAQLTELTWLADMLAQAPAGHYQAPSIAKILQCLEQVICGPAHVVFMSNGGFAAVHQAFLATLEA